MKNSFSVGDLYIGPKIIGEVIECGYGYITVGHISNDMFKTMYNAILFSQAIKKEKP